jgi:hypothetical protein
MPADVAFGKVISEPTAGAAEDGNLPGLKPDLLLELAIHGLLGRLVGMNPTLRKLPGVLADATTPK